MIPDLFLSGYYSNNDLSKSFWKRRSVCGVSVERFQYFLGLFARIVLKLATWWQDQSWKNIEGLSKENVLIIQDPNKDEIIDFLANLHC